MNQSGEYLEYQEPRFLCCSFWGREPCASFTVIADTSGISVGLGHCELQRCRGVQERWGRTRGPSKGKKSLQTMKIGRNGWDKYLYIYIYIIIYVYIYDIIWLYDIIYNMNIWYLYIYIYAIYDIYIYNVYIMHNIYTIVLEGMVSREIF